MGEHLVAAVAVLDLDIDMTAMGRASDWTARWAVDSAAGRALDSSAEQTPDSVWAVQNGVARLAGLEVAQHGVFPVLQSVQHGWYIVQPWEMEPKGV